jgi:non-ribosomal peptide synthetase component F
VITYRDLDRHANRRAARLVELGVRPGDNVGLFTVRSIPMLVGLLATLKSGAAYVPQDAKTVPAASLRHVLATAQIRVVLTLDRFADALPVLAGHHLLPVYTSARSSGPARTPGSGTPSCTGSPTWSG